jgi:hypothetical protein
MVFLRNRSYGKSIVMESMLIWGGGAGLPQGPSLQRNALT